MIYVRPLTDEERHELQRMTRQEVGRVSQRAQLVLLSASGHTVPDLATLFGLSRATVRTWLRRFATHGPAGLFDAPRSGRPAKVTPRVEQTLNQLLTSDPLTHGYLACFWTIAMLTLALFTLGRVVLSPSTVRATAHRLGWRWGRPRLAMPAKTDPQKAAKQWQIAHRVAGAGRDTVVLYADEARTGLLPLVRGLWHRRGEQVRLPTPGSNDSRAIFGALNIRSGRWTYLLRETMKTDDFLAFLRHLLTVYPHGKIVLIVDNYSIHTAKAVRVWLAGNRRLRVLYLPTYCSHLNPVEPVWRRLKDAVAANRLHHSMSSLVNSVHEFFGAMTPEQALTWAGINS